MYPKPYRVPGLVDGGNNDMINVLDGMRVISLRKHLFSPGEWRGQPYEARDGRWYQISTSVLDQRLRRHERLFRNKQLVTLNDVVLLVGPMEALSLTCRG